MSKLFSNTSGASAYMAASESGALPRRRGGGVDPAWIEEAENWKSAALKRKQALNKAIAQRDTMIALVKEMIENNETTITKDEFNSRYNAAYQALLVEQGVE